MITTRPKSNIIPIEPGRAWSSKSGGYPTMAPREYHPNVPADTVEALLWVSAETLVADIAERKRTGIWTPVRPSRGQFGDGMKKPHRRGLG